jgi:hypothetical protein
MLKQYSEPFINMRHEICIDTRLLRRPGERTKNDDRNVHMYALSQSVIVSLKNSLNTAGGGTAPTETRTSVCSAIPALLPFLRYDTVLDSCWKDVEVS